MGTVPPFEAMPKEDRARPSGFRALLMLVASMFIPVVLFLWGLWYFPLALFGPDRNLVPDDRGHARLNNYALEQFHRYVIGRTEDQQDAAFLFPQPNALAHVDGLWGTAPLYSLFRQCGAERETAYQFWMLALFGLNYWCSFLAGMALVKRPWLAACGAFLFAFGLHATVHLGHAELLPCFLMPLAFVLLWRWFVTARPIHIQLAAVATAGQFYCSIILGQTLLLGLIILSVAHLLIHRRNAVWMQLPGRKLFLQVGGALLLTATLLAPLLVLHFQVGDVVATQPSEEHVSGPTVRSLFLAPVAAWSWQDLTHQGSLDTPDQGRAPLFMGGVPLLALLVTAILLWRKRFSIEERLPLATMTVAWCLAVGISLLPIAPGSLSPMGVVYLLASFMLALMVLLTDWFVRQNQRWALSTMAMLPLLLVVDNRLDPRRTDRFDKHASRATIAQARTHLQGRTRTAVKALAYAPVLPVRHEHDMDDARISSHLSAMLAAQELSIPIVNAYADRLPREFLPFFHHPARGTLQQWCAFSGCDTTLIQWRDNVGLSIRHVERVRLMAHDGRYLCADADRYGALVLDRPEAEAWQGFVLVHLADGRTGIMVHSGRWAWAETYKHGSLLGDSPELGDLGLFRVERDTSGRMAFRCDNGRFVTAESDGSLTARADTLVPAAWFASAPLPVGYH